MPPAEAAAETDVPERDLGPLAWVEAELRRSLDGAAKSLRRFVREAAEAGLSDPDGLEASALRSARQQLHQVSGALEMVGMTGVAVLVRAMEGAVQKFLQRPSLCTEEAVATMERAGFALGEYFDALLAGKSDSPVGLFPQYREVQTLAEAERAHPADLWAPDVRGVPELASDEAVPLPYGPAARSQLDQAVLSVVKTGDPAAARRLSALAGRLAAAQPPGAPRGFWQICAGFFEGQALGLLSQDLHAKRVASRVLMQYTAFARGDTLSNERLQQDLLFFCAHARPFAAAEAPALAAVRAAWGLARTAPIDYDRRRFGRFDPAMLAQARKRIGAAAETWSALAGGDRQKIKAAADQFSLVADSLRRLHPQSAPLAEALTHALDATVRSGEPPATALAMEVATSVLYLQAAYEELDTPDEAMAERAGVLAGRLERAGDAAAPEPLEGWMEHLYRRVSDRQTMGSVVEELRSTLREAEQLLDQFFRQPHDAAPLVAVPGHMAQMRGVLSVLGLDQAAQAVVRMRDNVERLLLGLPADDAGRAAVFGSLGNSMGALSFLIDMLGYQPTLARRLFVFDELRGELRVVMAKPAEARAVPAAAPPLARAVPPSVPVSPAAGPFPDANAQASVRPSELPAPTASAARPAAAPAEPAAMPFPPAARPPAAAVPPQVASPPAPATDEDEDDEDDFDLREVFLEEAREVVAGGRASIAALAADPGDLSEQTTLRRAFHTLKGSARMVQLERFGEAAWAMEQLFNAWLAEQRPLPEAHRQLAAEALAAFGHWVEDIAEQRHADWDPDTFRRSAEALRAGQPVPPLLLPGMPAAEVAPAAAATAADEQEDAAPSADIQPTFLGEAGRPAAASVAGAEAISLLPADPDLGETSAAPDSIGTDMAARGDTVQIDEIDFAEFAAALADGGPKAVVPETAARPLAEGWVGELPVAQEAGATTEVEAPPSLPDSAQDAGSPPLPGDGETGASDAVDQADAAGAVPGGEVLLPVDVEPVVAEAAGRAIASQDGKAMEAEPGDAPVLPAADGDARPADPAGAALPPAVGAADVLAVGSPTAPPFDFAPSRPPAAEPEAVSVDTTVPTAELPQEADAEAVADADAPAATAAAADMDTDDTARLDAPDAPDAVPWTSDPLIDEVKAIGPLRISIPLYNVYLQEADEWSRRLVAELGEWSLESHDAPPANAVSLAHSLAGSSATVGFDALSGMARLVEQALLRVQRQGNGTAYQAGVLVDGAEDMRRLLHQFAAGFLKEPAPRLLRALQNLIDTDVDDAVPSAASFLRAEDRSGEATAPPAVAPEPDDRPATPLPDAAAPFAADPVAEPDADAVTIEPDAGQADDAQGEAEHAAAPEANVPAQGLSLDLPAAPPVAAAAAPRDLDADIARAVAAGSHLGDDLDVADAVDPDLFPIFEEEAQELLPALGAALRQWALRPDRQEARGEVLRALHTLKGSARLAGALRLGELAHRFETAIEDLGTVTPDVSAIEPLFAHADALRTELDVLRAGDDAPQAVVTTPVSRTDGAAAPSADVPVPSEPSEAPEADATGSAAAAAVDGATEAPPAARGVAVPQRAPLSSTVSSRSAGPSVRVRAQLLDRLVNQAGEVMIGRSRLEARLTQMQGSLGDLSGNLERLRRQLRDIEVQAETQMQSRLALARDSAAGFDPLEFDRFTRVQELTRMMAESVDDVATVQRNLQRGMQGAEDELVAQGRQARELQRDLLRTRMVEFDSIADRLYAVARQAAKETGKAIALDITGGAVEMDRGVLERLVPAFEHLLRNAVVHGVEPSAARAAAGKPATGRIDIAVQQEGNDVAVEFRDDGAGLDLDRIRDKGLRLGLIAPGAEPDGTALAELVFAPGFSTAQEVTELAGRGIGLDVVRAEVQASGGRIETDSTPGAGTRFRLVLPLTTAVTQVLMIRAGGLVFGVPATVVEIVRRATVGEIGEAYGSGRFQHDLEDVPFFWAGALLQASVRSVEPETRTRPVVIFRSARQRIALHVDEVLGQQEVVVKNLGPQLARMPGLSAMSVLPSGAVVLVYNPVALATVYGERVRAAASALADAGVSVSPQAGRPDVPTGTSAEPADSRVPLVLVVDDSITVRRVTQRLLRREGYRVALATDGLQALERLQEERPALVLSDIEMPRMDGFDLVRNIRADAALRDLPVVMITSRIAGKHREHAMSLGANHYLGKPYPEEELLGLVRRYALVGAEAG